MLVPEESRVRAIRHASRSPSERRLFAANSGQEGRAEVCRALIDASFGLRREDPGRMLDLAEAAVQLANGLPERPGWSMVLADLQLEARANLANAYRLCGKAREAAECWSATASLLASDLVSPLTRAHAQALKSIFHRIQNDRAQQSACLEEASAIYRRLGQPDRLGLVDLTRGHLRWTEGDFEGALACTTSAAEHLSETSEPERFADVIQALGLTVDALGHPMEALLLLHNTREVWERGRGSLYEARVRWLQARILLRLDQPVAAVQLFERVRTTFAKASLPLAAAQVSVEQALAHLRLGQPEEVERVALESYPVFLSQDLPHEATLALLLFVKAAKRRRTTERALERLLLRLRTLAGNPTSS